jgi:hypothetical protein
MPVPYSEQPKVEMLYAKFSNQPYDPRISWVLPVEFKLDPLLQASRQQFIEDEKPVKEPFVLAGPEFNTIR